MNDKAIATDSVSVQRSVAKGIEDRQLRDRIIQEIAASFPFSPADVEAVYNATLSFDNTIKVCRVAIELGFSFPLDVISKSQNGLVRDKG